MGNLSAIEAVLEDGVERPPTEGVPSRGATRLVESDLNLSGAQQTVPLRGCVDSEVLV